MRIGIYTLPLNYNYGGLLQAFALQTVLQNMGHEVVFIDRPLHSYEPFYKRPREKVKRFVRKYVLHDKSVRVFQENYEAKAYPEISKHTQKFINQYLNTIVVTDTHQLNENDYDAIIVGSDQIWRCAFHDTSRKLYDAYLEFAENWSRLKRISYAASFGTDKWEYPKDKAIRCKSLLAKFDAISVREASGVTLLKQYFGFTAKHVLDPTMLLDRADYAKIFELAHTPLSQGNMMVYVLDDSTGKNKLISEYEKRLHLSAFRVNSQADNINLPISQRIQPPVDQWLRGFQDARFVVTDSFHACVFSILFGKPFVAIGNKNRGMSRFESLLQTFGLSDRLISVENNDFVIPQSDILLAQTKLNSLRAESMQFLTSALNDLL